MARSIYIETHDSPMHAENLLDNSWDVYWIDKLLINELPKKNWKKRENNTSEKPGRLRNVQKLVCCIPYAPERKQFLWKKYVLWYRYYWTMESWPPYLVNGRGILMKCACEQNQRWDKIRKSTDGINMRIDLILYRQEVPLKSIYASTSRYAFQSTMEPYSESSPSLPTSRKP